MKIHLFPNRRAKLSPEDWFAKREQFDTDVKTYLTEKGAVDLKS